MKRLYNNNARTTRALRARLGSIAHKPKQMQEDRTESPVRCAATRYSHVCGRSPAPNATTKTSSEPMGAWATHAEKCLPMSVPEDYIHRGRVRTIQCKTVSFYNAGECRAFSQLPSRMISLEHAVCSEMPHMLHMRACISETMRSD